MKRFSSFAAIIFCLSLFLSKISLAGGVVYLVIGSDTAIWNGMSTSRYNNDYDYELYIDPQGNAYEVMSPSFRQNLTDSYGGTMKLTWWMMAGNIFRYAVNNYVPVNNIMTLYLMKKYHGEMIEHWGDELTLHYHTFNWSDYDNDGIYFWNQAENFTECYDDWRFTLAQFLIEEEVFPVSFRSGWEYMDNEWQAELDRVLPYSLHNKSPVKHSVDEEPLNNIIDWSQAPLDFVPYHPSPDNYQIPGDGKGWNVRAIHLRDLANTDIIEEIFSKARDGMDQVVCVWGHLPEEDFNDNLVKINQRAHETSAKYDNVKFRYCTAIEAMQMWQKTDDTTGPLLTFETVNQGDNIKFRITADEPIFQNVPFVSVKDLYKDYSVLEIEQTSEYTWETTSGVKAADITKAAAAVCDTAGNQSIKSINFIPDDVYIDDESDSYSELSGSFGDYTEYAWGTKSRKALLFEGDTLSVKYRYIVEKTGPYNIFFQVPAIDNQVSFYQFEIISSGEIIDSVTIKGFVRTYKWNYLSTKEFEQNDNVEIVLKVFGEEQTGKALAVDALLISPYVLERDLRLDQSFVDLGEVKEKDSLEVEILLSNAGYKNLTISNISASAGYINFNNLHLPIVIEGMSTVSIIAVFYASEPGIVNDRILIESDDQKNPAEELLLTANVQNYFEIIDNEDSLHYLEYGGWFYSNAQAYGESSRYSWLNEPGGYAKFTINLPEEGLYNILEIVPNTVNASNNALYTIDIAGVNIDSVYINQNEGSGNWILIGTYFLPDGEPVTVKVINNSQHTDGLVLRADAVKFALAQRITSAEYGADQPNEFKLMQNYPNPFNPATKISYELPARSEVLLIVYDILGREVKTLVNQTQTPGKYSVEFRAVNLSSGVYFYTLRANEFILSGKMLLIR